ncbi:MAG: aspartate aminotransferase family protein [Halanaerobium sp.]|nr:aspartate aminotransferase family protein [Halanaerobium sp.]
MDKEMYSIDDALGMGLDRVMEEYKEHINPGFARLLGLLDLERQFVRAKGSKVWDVDGHEYLDFLGGFGSLNFGHNHPRLRSIFSKTEELPFVLQVSLNGLTAAAGHNLNQITPGHLTHTFFGNSGAEAVEGAIKLAKIYTRKPGIVYTEGSFHGKTTGALSITGREKYQKPFKPLLEACDCVPYGDLDRLEQVLKRNDIAGVVMEPIQGEGGIIVPPEGYLQGVQDLCHKYGALFILDEIQTGMGRTGFNFACLRDGLEPDILCLAKSLGGGVMPVGAFTTRKEIWEEAYGTINTCLMHTSTFGGNSLASAAVIVATQLLVEENLADRAAEMGQILIRGLVEMKNRYELIKAVRGRGLFVGVEFYQPAGEVLDKLSGGLVNKFSREYFAAMVAGELLNQHRVITAYTINNPNVIRLEPPLVVTEEEVNRVLNSLESIFNKNRGLLKISLKSAKRALGSILSRRK